MAFITRDLGYIGLTLPATGFKPSVPRPPAPIIRRPAIQRPAAPRLPARAPLRLPTAKPPPMGFKQPTSSRPPPVPRGCPPGLVSMNGKCVPRGQAKKLLPPTVRPPLTIRPTVLPPIAPKVPIVPSLATCPKGTRLVNGKCVTVAVPPPLPTKPPPLATKPPPIAQQRQVMVTSEPVPGEAADRTLDVSPALEQSRLSEPGDTSLGPLPSNGGAAFDPGGGGGAAFDAEGAGYDATQSAFEEFQQPAEEALAPIDDAALPAEEVPSRRNLWIAVGGVTLVGGIITTFYLRRRWAKQKGV